MNKVLTLAILLGLVGLVVGYLIFAKGLGGDYINVMDLVMPGQNFLEDGIKAIAGYENIRFNILMCGLGGTVGGALIGLVIALSGKKSR
ncbi:MAG: hypothetical protein JW969_07355 [Spirochaetales bacterium]|nr:hypothetical protein [Spirochaetales bacterium]